MRNIESNNPALKIARRMEGSGHATFNGVLNRTMFSIFLVILGASITWIQFLSSSSSVGFYMGIGVMVGLVAALITAFIPSVAHITVPIYALFEGFFLGGISAKFNYIYNGIVIQSVMITLGILVVMLILYKFNIIRATGKFKKGVIAATLGIGVVYLLTFVLSIFGITIPFIHTNSPIGILISVVIIIIAALNFILDFDNIEYIVYSGAPKKMEWIGAFGIITTLIWMYLEIIRLLAILKDK